MMKRRKIFDFKRNKDMKRTCERVKNTYHVQMGSNIQITGAPKGWKERRKEREGKEGRKKQKKKSKATGTEHILKIIIQENTKNQKYNERYITYMENKSIL